MAQRVEFVMSTETMDDGNGVWAYLPAANKNYWI
jgi:hypothetical protein